MALARTRSHKHFQLDAGKLKRAQRALRAKTETETIERALDVVITESVFNIPGIGRLVVDAINRRDYPVIQGVTLVFSAVYVLINLLVDLACALFDPRIRL